MEVADRAVAEELVVHWKDACASGVLVVAGKGNNGGDGWVVARYLHQHGIAVEVLSISGVQSGDCARNESIARGLGVPVVDPQSASPCGLIVDALLGTGGSGALRGEAAERVSWMNSHAAPVLSIDLPSGVCGDTGRVVGPAVRAQIFSAWASRNPVFLEPPRRSMWGRFGCSTLALLGLRNRWLKWSVAAGLTSVFHVAPRGATKDRVGVWWSWRAAGRKPGQRCSAATLHWRWGVVS